MKQENFERAKKIERSQHMISDVRHILGYPYPSMFSNNKYDQKRGICYDGNSICFASFDDQTNKELKEAMRNVLDKRNRELSEELQSL